MVQRKPERKVSMDVNQMCYENMAFLLCSLRLQVHAKDR